MDRDTLLAEVVANLDRSERLTRFTAPLEVYYRGAIAEQRRRSLFFASVLGLVILVAFSIPRVIYWPSAPEVMRAWFTIIGALVVTIAIGMVVASKPRRHELIDRATMIEMVVLAILVGVLIRYDEPIAATGTMYCFVMVPVAASTLASLHFRQTLLVIVVGDLIFLGAVASKPDLDVDLHVPAVLLTIAGSVMSLWGSWNNDRQHRALFLFLTRERLESEKSAERNAELRVMTEIDPLTGIPNRRVFEDRFEALLADEHRTSLAVIMIDVDHFKAFNDHAGHPEGDRCLIAVARALASELRSEDDLVARLGGEEFVVLAEGPHSSDVPVLLERLRRSVEKLAIPHPAAVAGSVVTVSLGCTVVEAGELTTRREALERADTALYAAKNIGRNRWTIAPGPGSDGEPGLTREVHEVGL